MKRLQAACLCLTICLGHISIALDAKAERRGACVDLGSGEVYSESDALLSVNQCGCTYPPAIEGCTTFFNGGNCGHGAATTCSGTCTFTVLCPEDEMTVTKDCKKIDRPKKGEIDVGMLGELSPH